MKALRNLLGVSLLLALRLAGAQQNNALLEAEEAVKNGAPLSLYQHLAAHPLYPMVEYQYWQNNLQDVAGVSAFLKAHPDSYFSDDLAKSAYKQWIITNPQAIIATYRESFADDEITGLYLQAQRRPCPNTAPSPAAEQIYALANKNLDEALYLARSNTLAGVKDYEHAYNRLVSKLARADDSATYEMWARMPAGSQSDNTIFDVIAYAQRRNDWARLPQLLGKLDEKAYNKAEVQYWLGRAAEKSGNRSQAESHFRKAASQRDYFGFLAAEKLGQAPQFHNRPTRQINAQRAQVMNGVQRALILKNLGKGQRAMAELQAVAKGKPPELVEQIALVAHQQGWHIGAISILAQNKIWDNLNLRFPIKYRQEIESLARQHRIKTSEIYAIIRKESIFQEEIKSAAGALGLMQVMPATASDTARKYGISYGGSGQLTNPSTNLAIGTQYLSNRLQEFRSLAVAAASYNAGPNRARQWLDKYPNLPLDEWIAQIPFNETRDYVKKVMEYEKIYDYLLRQ